MTEPRSSGSTLPNAASHRRPRAQARRARLLSRNFVLAIAAHMADATASMSVPVQEHPNNQDLARRFVELRIAAGVDPETVAARGGLDLMIVHELETGTRKWALYEIEAFAIALDVPLVKVFAPWGGPVSA